MQRIAAGDRVAYDEIVRLYMRDMYHFAFSILKSPSKAEDAVQDACLRLWNRADQWKPSGRLRSWLLRIIHNLCMDEIRKRKGEVSLDESIFDIEDTAPSQLEVQAKKQSSKAVTEALYAVPDRQRIALTLAYYHSYSNIELAFIMGISIDATESLLARGRQKLRNLLSESKEHLLEGIRDER